MDQTFSLLSLRCWINFEVESIFISPTFQHSISVFNSFRFVFGWKICKILLFSLSCQNPLTIFFLIAIIKPQISWHFKDKKENKKKSSKATIYFIFILKSNFYQFITTKKKKINKNCNLYQDTNLFNQRQS